MQPNVKTTSHTLLIVLMLLSSAVIATPASALGTYTISGNAGVGGAILSYDDGGPQTVSADEYGYYIITVPDTWSGGTITPSKAGYAFTPASMNYPSLSSDQTGQDYSATIVKQVAASLHHVCGIQPGGTLYCWGDNDYGQTTPPEGTFTQVSSGYDYSCGLKLDNSVACWGYDGDGQIPPPTDTFTQISAGPFMICGLKTDGTIACWGYDWDGTTSNIPSGAFIQVGAGATHACAIKPDHTATCWGNDDYGQVSATPADTLTQLDAGWDSTCGIKTDGTLVCWGNDEYGKADPPAGTFIQINVGIYHACGIKTDGTVACWGKDDWGQVSDAPSGTFTDISVGYWITCGVSSTERWVCWGEGGISSKYTSPYSISGRMGMMNATLSYDDGGAQTASTDSDGRYWVYVSDGWSGTITPTKTNFTFTPSSRTYNNVIANLENEIYSIKATLTAAAGQDGWLRESQQGSHKGGSANATSKAIILGDDVANRQYRAILSFDMRQISSAYGIKITSAVLKVYRSGGQGSNPFKMLGNLLLDFPFLYFGKDSVLRPEDFSAAPWVKKVGGNVTHSGKWYSIPLTSTGRVKLVHFIGGFAQFRVRFSLPSNLNGAADQVYFFSGNGPAAYRPKLVIKYDPIVP